MTAKRIIMIAGPNGAGKTTFATEFLPNEADCPEFINADLIAAGLSPFRPELAAIKAGRGNFTRLYRDLVDDWVEYDNSGSGPRIVDWKGKL